MAQITNNTGHFKSFAVHTTAQKVTLILVIFYIVGVIGFIVPQTHHLFLMLTKWALMLNFGLLIWFHQTKFTLKSVLVFSAIFLFGFLIEVVGVNTGIIFGNYQYGSGLGIKIMNTPLMIGVNWLMLSYCFFAIFAPLSIHKWLKIAYSALGMLIYDLILEQSAGILDMWYWVGNSIPLLNYLSWLIVAAFLQYILHLSKISIINPLAKAILWCQGIFFLLLAIYKFTFL